MATWTTLPDAALEPGKPIRSIDGLALRDNPVAITEGAAGAPKMQTNGITDSAVTTAKLANDSVTTAKLANDSVTTAKLAANERMTTANVLNAAAGASVGAVGTYAFLRTTFTATGTNVTSTYQFGTTHAGSSLRYTQNLSTNALQESTTAPAGTWRAMGQAFRSTPDGSGGTVYEPAATVFLRIS